MHINEPEQFFYFTNTITLLQVQYSKQVNNEILLTTD